MKLSVTVEGLAGLGRIDPAPIVARLQAGLDAELQASPAPAAPPRSPRDAQRHRDALDRALSRLR